MKKALKRTKSLKRTTQLGTAVNLCLCIKIKKYHNMRSKFHSGSAQTKQLAKNSLTLFRREREREREEKEVNNGNASFLILIASAVSVQAAAVAPLTSVDDSSQCFAAFLQRNELHLRSFSLTRSISLKFCSTRSNFSNI